MEKVRRIPKTEALDCINTLILYCRQNDNLVNEERVLSNMEEKLETEV